MLFEAFRSKNEPDSVDEFIEQLQHYMATPASQANRSLADKLNETGRGDVVEDAAMAKERAMKKIMRFQTSAAAQEIFAYVLGDLHRNYISHVRPLIASNASRLEVDRAFDKEVITPVVSCMQPSSLGLTPDIVMAMMYYLAGNCHIRWD